jgi:hypothetical protein
VPTAERPSANTCFSTFRIGTDAVGATNDRMYL